MIPDSEQHLTEEVVKPTRLKLHFQDSREVVVTAADQHTFVTSMGAAAEACRAALKNEHDKAEWEAEFRRYLGHVNLWSDRHQDVVRRVWVAVPPRGLEIYVVTIGTAYRFDFDDDVTAFDLDLRTSFPTVPSHVMQIPDDGRADQEALFSSADAFLVYGN